MKEDIKKLIQLKEARTKALEDYDSFIKELHSKHGEGTFFYREVLDGVTVKGTIVDNVRKLKEGEDVYKATKTSPLTIDFTKPLVPNSKVATKVFEEQDNAHFAWVERTEEE